MKSQTTLLGKLSYVKVLYLKLFPTKWLTLKDIERLADVLDIGDKIRFKEGIEILGTTFYYVLYSNYGKHYYNQTHIDMNSRFEVNPLLSVGDEKLSLKNKGRKISLACEYEDEFEIIVRGLFAVRSGYTKKEFMDSIIKWYPEFTEDMHKTFK